LRSLDCTEIAAKLFAVEVVNLIVAIHEYRDRMDLFVEAKPDILSHLPDIVRMQRAGTSNKIEGIVAAEVRLKEFVQ